MTNTFTAEEVRDLVNHISGHAITVAEKAEVLATLTAYADLLERREAGVTGEIVSVAKNEFSAWMSFDEDARKDAQFDVAMQRALEAVWPVAAEPSDKAKLSERKTVHEWLNALHIEREEFGKPLCLLRRLRILCDRYQETCDQLSHEMHKQVATETVAQTDNSHRFASDEHGLTGLIQACKVASSPSQGATVSHMRWLLSQCAEHLAAQPRAVPNVVNEVMAEVGKAIRKFPTWPVDPLHAIGVFNEEAGELAKAVLQQVYEPHKNAPGDVRKEATQAAAMALRFLASIDSYDWTPGTQHEQPAFADAPQPGEPK